MQEAKARWEKREEIEGTMRACSLATGGEGFTRNLAGGGSFGAAMWRRRSGDGEVAKTDRVDTPRAWGSPWECWIGLAA